MHPFNERIRMTNSDFGFVLLLTEGSLLQRRLARPLRTGVLHLMRRSKVLRLLRCSARWYYTSGGVEAVLHLRWLSVNLGTYLI